MISNVEIYSTINEKVMVLDLIWSITFENGRIEVNKRSIIVEGCLNTGDEIIE